MWTKLAISSIAGQKAGFCGTQELLKVKISSLFSVLINGRLNTSLICSWDMWMCFFVYLGAVFLSVFVSVSLINGSLFVGGWWMSSDVYTVASHNAHFEAILWVCCVTLKCQQMCLDTVGGSLTLHKGGRGLNPVMLTACLVLSECSCKPTFQKELRPFKVSSLTRRSSWPHCNCSERTLGCHSAVP